MPRQNINFKNQRLDLVILHKGQHVNVELGTGLRNSGWRGGQFVKYTNTTAPIGNTGKYLGIVEASNGSASVCGFLLFASTTAVSDDPEFMSSYKPESTGVAAINKNMGKYKFFQFETENAAKRANPMAGADLVYALNDRLYVSSEGLLSHENEGGNAICVGTCFHVPSGLADRDNYVGLDCNIDNH